MKQETAILTSRLKQREPAACQQLLSDYGPAVFRIVQRIVTQHEDAEEVYQDVFVKVLQGIDSYDPDQAALGTWISRIAYHEALNSVRGRKPQMVYMEDYNTEVSYAESDSADSEQTLQQLEQAIDKLQPQEQAVITMFYYDDMSLADIAYVTGSQISTIGSQLSRIRKKLYQIIKTL